MIDNQIRFDDISPEYRDFVEKFKPKKTTDDCYTPEPVFNTVAAYVTEKYGIRREDMVRPFFPGGDYLRHHYPEGCAVVDNPPFSILSRIVKDYNAAGVRFFLFAPYLTCFEIKNCTRIVCDAEVTYENGAKVNTCFVTNMEPGIIARSEPDLRERIRQAMKEVNTGKAPPKYKYPPQVLTATMLGYLSVHGVEYVLREGEGYFLRALSSQRNAKKTIFGAGFLISEAKAEEKAKAERIAAANAAQETAERLAAEKDAAIPWALSETEKEIIRELGKGVKT